MKTYINKKTGATFDSTCTISGGDWEVVENTKKTTGKDKKETEK